MDVLPTAVTIPMATAPIAPIPIRITERSFTADQDGIGTAVIGSITAARITEYVSPGELL